jgi:adenosylcobinamide kinase/adenosylcobinamide-phosphate guanylyltransferase
MAEPAIARSELIVGGQKSGKSRRAQDLAEAWLKGAPGRRAMLIATAVASDDEMRGRIARHQGDRARQLPGMRTLEEPLALPQRLAQHSAAEMLVVVDCLTLWLTNLQWPGHCPALPAGSPTPDPAAATAALLVAIEGARGPVVLVSNEIGLGVIPMGRDVRDFVDALGLLNQRVGALCERVTLMSAGLPLNLKGVP